MQPTSVLAHDQHETSGKAESGRQRVLCLVRESSGSTACELYTWLFGAYGLTRHEISRRLPELRAAGLVHNGEKRKCRIKGNLQLTWFYGKGPDGEAKDKPDTTNVEAVQGGGLDVPDCRAVESVR